MILLYDGYSCQIQFTVLQFFKNNRCIVIEIPAHTSHVLQPLDVSAYGPFKSYIQREVNNRAMGKRVLNVFDVSDILQNIRHVTAPDTAYFMNYAVSDAVTAGNVISGFKKYGIWNVESN